MKSAEALWDDFCRLRLQSTAYRAVDDPVVASAYQDWLRAYLTNERPRESAVVIPFPKLKGASHDR